MEVLQLLVLNRIACYLQLMPVAGKGFFYMSDFFDDKTENFSLKKKLSEQLALKEWQLEDGSLVSNADGICQMMIQRALDGDLQVVELIDRISNNKK